MKASGWRLVSINQLAFRPVTDVAVDRARAAAGGAATGFGLTFASPNDGAATLLLAMGLAAGGADGFTGAVVVAPVPLSNNGWPATFATRCAGEVAAACSGRFVCSGKTLGTGG